MVGRRRAEKDVSPAPFSLNFLSPVNWEGSLLNHNDGVELLDAIESKFRKYTIQQSDEAYWALALYVVFTHCIHHFDYATRLLITSAEKRSGKTTTLTVISNLVFAPLITANATTPAIFRSLGQGPRTLCFDEADTIFGTKMKAEQNEDLRGMLNAGFQRGTPVLRVVGPQHEVHEFETFAPAVMCAIGGLPDTIVDRAINIRLRRRKNSESVSGYRIKRDQPGLHDLRDRASQWAEDNAGDLDDVEPVNPLDDRAADLWEPLLAVATVAGGHWVKRADQAARFFTTTAAEADTERSAGVELLSDIRGVLDLVQGSEIQSSRLVNYLTSMEESRWAEEGLTARRLSTMLAAYEVRPARMSSGNGRGYKVARFEDAFARYLPVMRPEGTEVTGSAVNQRSASVTSKSSVASSDRSPQSDRSKNPGNTGNRSLLSVSVTSRTEVGQFGCLGCAQGVPTDANINRGVNYCGGCISQDKHLEGSAA